MAGDWIKIENVTPDKPEVFQIAEALEIDPDAVVGKLIRLWIWADEQTYNGDAASVTFALLDRITAVSGFGNALIRCGWLTLENDVLMFPNFDRHNGQTAKNRALAAKRNAKLRLRKRDAASVTIASPREEKRREDIKPPIVPQGTERAFEQFWESVHVKTGRRAAEKAHAVAVKTVAVERKITPAEAAAYILDRMQAFAKSPRAHPKDISPVHPATWLNQGRYDDDPAAWQGNGHAAGKPESTYTPCDN